MRPRPTRARANSHEEPDQSYQVDAIVSLFAIMLILLITLVTATASQDAPVVTNYKTKDVKSLDMPLRTFQTTYHSREHWVVFENGALAQIDLARLVEQFDDASLGVEQEYQDSNGRFFATFEPDAQEIGSYNLSLTIYEFDPEDWIYAQVLNVQDDAMLAGWAGSEVRTILYPEKPAAAHVPALSKALDDGARSGTFMFARRDKGTVLHIRRSSLNFQLELIFRA